MDKINDILNRLRLAHEKGRGVRLSWEDLNTLSVTTLGEAWSEPDPRSSDGIEVGYRRVNSFVNKY